VSGWYAVDSSADGSSRDLQRVDRSLIDVADRFAEAFEDLCGAGRR